jgi:hypothetical protein
MKQNRISAIQTSVEQMNNILILCYETKVLQALESNREMKKIKSLDIIKMAAPRTMR